jgi:hypothetical protein
MRIRRQLFFSSLFILSCHILQAQANYTGKWTLATKEHVIGPEYANALPDTIIVTQSKDSLILVTVFIDIDQQITRGRLSIALNGNFSSHTGKTSMRKYTSSLSWGPDKKTLTITTVISMPENDKETDFTRVERWDITDGKLQVYKKSIETTSDSWEVKGVYNKL